MTCCLTQPTLTDVAQCSLVLEPGGQEQAALPIAVVMACTTSCSAEDHVPWAVCANIVALSALGLVRRHLVPLSTTSFQVYVQPGSQPKRGMFGGVPKAEVRIEMGDMGGSNGDAAYYEDTEENVAFRNEFETRKAKQDEVLDEIEKGVGRMGDIATDMGQELNKQDKLMDEVEAQVCSYRWSTV
jgi:hypothetical protein